MTTGQIVTAIGGGASMAAFVGGLWTYITGRSVRSADAAKVISEGASTLVGPLRAEVEALRGDLDELRSRVGVLESQIEDERRRTWVAVAYIKKLISALRKLDPDHELPELPAELRDMIEEGM